MSIKPISDIVLDVARAADPSKSMAAAERLSRLSPADPSSDSFSGHLGTMNGGEAELQNQMALMSAKPATTLAPVDARTKAYKGLEQLVLQSLVENMLPKETGGFFGGGTAGDIWRSMLAEQLAAQMGKTVDLGLFKSASAASGAAHLIKPAESLARRQS